MGARKQDIDQRFVAKIVVDEQTGCWEWQATRTRDGYGQFKVDGMAIGSHRFAYARYVGPIPAERPELDHLCHNRACANPEHLEPVTRNENMRRMWTDNPKMAVKLTLARFEAIRSVTTHKPV